VKTIICGIPFEIIQREPNTRADTNFGRMDVKMAQITIDKTMPPEMREATIVHEWMHAVYEINGIDHTEIQIGVLATELYRQGFRIKVEA
jgi:hypothetical protein